MAPELRRKNQFLIFTTPVSDLPVELKDDVFVLQLPLPTQEELDLLFAGVTKDLDRGNCPGGKCGRSSSPPLWA